MTCKDYKILNEMPTMFGRLFLTRTLDIIILTCIMTYKHCNTKGGKELSIGSEIAEKRRFLGLSQEELANKLNVARQTVSAWERDIFIPDSSLLIKMGELFQCSIDELVNPTRPRPKPGKAKIPA